MKLIGLTGGIGMGKSAAAARLAERGMPVIDTDRIAREVAQKGEPALDAIQEAFGPGVIDEGGELDRAALGKIVFRDAGQRSRLEGILHPLIRARWLMETEKWRAAGAKAGVVVIPLLFETGAGEQFESVICIACSRQIQSARLRGRGWTTEEVAGRLSAQWPIEKKMDRSQYVIWNDASVPVLWEQLERVPPLKGRD